MLPTNHDNLKKKLSLMHDKRLKEALVMITLHNVRQVTPELCLRN